MFNNLFYYVNIFYKSELAKKIAVGASLDICIKNSRKTEQKYRLLILHNFLSS